MELTKWKIKWISSIKSSGSTTWGEITPFKLFPAKEMKYKNNKAQGKLVDNNTMHRLRESGRECLYLSGTLPFSL